MSILVDTNILLRRMQPAHGHHAASVESVARLLITGESACITPQIVAEFWNVATRPVAANGLGLSAAAALAELQKIERALTVLPDLPAAYDEWKRLIDRHAVTGSKVHDARLVAAMNVHGVSRLLTFNTGDFARYDLELIHPFSVV